MISPRFGAAVACAGLAFSCVHAQLQRPFTVHDDIEMTRISDPRPDSAKAGSDIVWPSPDGRWAAIVVSRGIFESDQIESKILIFDLRKVFDRSKNGRTSGRRPRMVAKVLAQPYSLETAPYGPVIKNLRWSPDSHLVYFRAMGKRGRYRLCSVSVDGGSIRWLSAAEEEVTQFDVVDGKVVYIASDPGLHSINRGQTINRDAVNITGARLQEILFPNDIAAHAPGLFRLYRQEALKPRQSALQTPHYSLLDIPYLSSNYPFAVSPSGTELIKLEPITTIPDAWTQYEPASGLELYRLKRNEPQRFFEADNIVRPVEYLLVDLVTGKKLPIFRAPNARSLGYQAEANRAAWSRDGNRVLVTNTFLPFDGPENALRREPCALATIDFPKGKVRCAFFEKTIPDLDGTHLQDAAFGVGRDQIQVLMSNRLGAETLRTYALANETWSLKSTHPLAAPVQLLSELSRRSHLGKSSAHLFVHQDLNDPPKIWAKPIDGESFQVWDPNPQLRNIAFGAASMYTWKDRDGQDWSGILVKPVGYQEGIRYPLVLQLYNYVEGQFITDGLDPTAFAARQLASAGIAVLQIRKKPNRISADDPLVHLEAYRSAIDHLEQDGLADRAKVGAVGFSWTCWDVEEALVRDPQLFAAATIADGLDNGYMQYKLFTVGFEALQNQMNEIRGGPPFGKNLQHWVDEAPGFHLDRVHTPLRIEAINPSSVLQEWELYSSLEMLHRPVDMVYFPAGTHIHQLPLERLESQQGNVDWMRFWLKGEEDPDPKKRVQYERWRSLKAETAQVQTRGLSAEQ